MREVCLPDGQVFPVTGQGFLPAGEVRHAGSRVDLAENAQLAVTIRAVVLCNQADLHRGDGTWIWSGDAADVAALSLGVKSDLHRERLLDMYPQLSSIPLEPEHQFAVSFHQDGERDEVVVKGAPERVLDMCGQQLSPPDRSRAEQVVVSMAACGLRVIAVASGQLTELLRPEDAPF